MPGGHDAINEYDIFLRFLPESVIFFARHPQCLISMFSHPYHKIFYIVDRYMIVFI